MPTGYTSDIYEGKEVSGKDFVLKCARAFGALIQMRDEPLNTPIPNEFKPTSYHLKSIKQDKEQLEKYRNMSLEEAERQAETDYLLSVGNAHEQRKRALEMKSRYEKTLNEVKAWEIPSSEHKELKEFAIKQLEESIQWDCNLKFCDPNLVVKLSPEEWLERKISMCEKNIKYHQEEHEKEIEHVNTRNKWINQLRESLEN